MQRIALLTAGLLLSASLSLSPHLASAQSAQSVIISEVAWAGGSASAADEWIELYNTTDQTVDLSGWTLTGAATSGGALTLPAGSTVGSHSTFLIANYDAEHTSSTLGVAPGFVTTTLSLSNSGQNLVLQNGAGATIDAAGSGGTPFAGTSGGVGGDDVLRVYASMERIFPVADGTLKESWATASTATGFDTGVSDLGTPGTVTMSQPVADEPAAATPTNETGATESSTETPDAENAATSSVATETATESFVETTATESSEPSAATVVAELAVVESPSENQPQTSSSLSSSSSSNSYTPRRSLAATTTQDTPGTSIPQSLALSEIYPNTNGDDAQEEFIEVINMGSAAVDLDGWTLEDAAGKRFTQTESLLIAPSGFASLSRATTKITLNNTNELVRLIRADGRTVDEYAFDKSQKGQSVARINGNWVWTEAPTPSAQNRLVISAPVVDETPRKTSPKKETSTSTTSVSANTTGRSAGTMSRVTIQEAQALKDGTRVELSGTVLVEPGILGKQIFYVSNGTHGIQVYKHDANFPELSRTDRVEMTGTMGTSNGVRRVKVGAKDTLTRVGPAEGVVAQETTLTALKNASAGSLVRVDGIVLSRSASSLTLEQDGSQAVARLATGARIDAAMFERGKDVSLTGIVTKSGDAPQISPRDAADIHLTQTTAPEETVTALSGRELQQTRQARAGGLLAAATAVVFLGLGLRKALPYLKRKYGYKPLRFANQKTD